jgi:hypothetical protein
VVIILLAVALVGTLAWQGIQALLHPAPKYPTVTVPGSENYTARGGTAGGAATPAWQTDVADALQGATAEGTAGNVTAAEVQVDRAASIVTSARMQGQKAGADFYTKSLGGLDKALATAPENTRMAEHVTLARMELANLRSADDGKGANAAGGDDAPDLTSYPGASATPISNVGPDAEARHAKSIPGQVVMASPLAVSADAMLDPGTAGGSYLDATLMPETSEVLLPPATRKLADGVRVEGLTIEGATQTLDGVRWRNVTFVGARLRYEGGEISLQNVKFVRCRFGFTTDERGAKLADAIALGKTSFEIQ